jgi:hypothetical protein
MISRVAVQVREAIARHGGRVGVNGLGRVQQQGLPGTAHITGETPQRYGHIVVDEAQDLTPMQARSLRRRSAARGSMTTLGDLAQAAAPTPTPTGTASAPSCPTTATGA